MLIKNFQSASALESNKLIDCGILKYKRDIYLFVDPNAYKNNTVTSAKAVIINSSVSKGSKEGNMIQIAIDNSVIIRYSVYFCNVIFEIPGNIQLSQFVITSAYSKELQSLFDQNISSSFMPGMYSASLGRLAATDETLFWELIGTMDSGVIPPEYYTEMHEYKVTGDLFTMCNITEIYSGSELIDNNTSTHYMDINLWDTMKYEFLGIMNKVEEKTNNTIDILDRFYNDFNDFIGNDGYFIYESDKKGKNNPGTNIVSGSIPYKSFYLPEYIKNNVTNTLLLFEQSCHDIEKEYGPIKVQCYPSKIGNKVKINFKDYIQFPKELTPLGNVDQDGAKSSSDKGFHIEKIIDDTLENLQYCGYYDYQ
jgi:hypothetical protein